MEKHHNRKQVQRISIFRMTQSCSPGWHFLPQLGQVLCLVASKLSPHPLHCICFTEKCRLIGVLIFLPSPPPSAKWPLGVISYCMIKSLFFRRFCWSSKQYFTSWFPWAGGVPVWVNAPNSWVNFSKMVLGDVLVVVSEVDLLICSPFWFYRFQTKTVWPVSQSILPFSIHPNRLQFHPPGIS